MTTTFYGWYSPEAARLYGGSIYTRPDGSEVHVTDVTRALDASGNIVWGTAGEAGNIVWGTADNSNIVWGTVGVNDNIVWGTADNIVWGTVISDSVVWGAGAVGPDNGR